MTVTTSGHTRFGPRPLVGREVEQAVLRHVLDEAERGRGRLVLVSGEAGIGKTALVEDLLDLVRRRGHLTLLGVCHDLATTPPYGPWIAMFARYQRGAEGAGRAAASQGVIMSPEQFEGVTTRDSLFAQVTTSLTNAAGSGALVLVLEDLHWSDRASLDLLHHLAIPLPDLPLLVLATYRDSDLESGTPLGSILPSLARMPGTTRIGLRRLPRSAIRELITRGFDLPPDDVRRLAAWLFRNGEGNPFFTEELLRGLGFEGTLAPTDDGHRLGDLGALQAPPLIRQFISQRIERLSDHETLLLQVAAVIGTAVPLDLWSEVAGAGDDELDGLFERVIALGLVEETADPPGLRFRHALIRAAIHDSMSLPRRRTWHRRVAEQLERYPRADPDELAHHYRMAGDARAGRWLIAAGERAIQSHAYAIASERYEQAIEILGEGDLAPSDLGWLLCDLALSFRFADASKALRYLDRAAETAASASDPALEIYVRWSRTQIRSLRGDNALDDLNRVAADYRALVDDGDPRRLTARIQNALGFGALAYVYARYGRYDEAPRLARKELDDNPGMPSENTVRAYAALGLAHAGQGRPAEARRAFANGRNAASLLRDPHLTGVLLNWELMEVLLVYDADQRDARERLAAAAAEAWGRVDMPGSPADDDEDQPGSTMSVFATLLLDGDWETATQEALIDLEFDGMRFDALRLLCIVEARRGNDALAERYLLQALPDGPSTPPANFYFASTLQLLRNVAGLALTKGDVKRAIQWIEAYDRWMEWSGRTSWQAEGLILRARLHELLGEMDLAGGRARQAYDLAQALAQPLSLLEAERYLGHLATLEGDYERALEHLNAALRIAQACSAPYETALVQLTRVRPLVAIGDHDAARAAMDAVREIAGRLGVAPFIERLGEIESELFRAAGHAIPGGLSARELDVLRLVARGMTDAEAGDQLFLSPRTVSRHLRSIYNKLGVNSRTAAAAFAFEHGLLDDAV